MSGALSGADDLEVLLRIRNADITVLELGSRTIPKDVKQLLKAGLALDPKDRPSSSEFLRALENSLRMRDPKGESPKQLCRLLERLELIPTSADSDPLCDRPSPRRTIRENASTTVKPPSTGLAIRRRQLLVPRSTAP